MAVTYRSRSLGTALRYKGREGMWTWLLHRATGLGILAFLIAHVVDTALVIYWPHLYDDALELYKSPVIRVAEFLIFFAVLYHAVNGLRIIVQDFWPYVMQKQRQLTWAVAIIVVLALIPVGWIMLGPLFGRPEPGVERHERRMRERAGGEFVAAGTQQAPAAQTPDGAAPVLLTSETPR